MSANTFQVRIPRNGYTLSIDIVPTYGARPGTFGDSYMGDVHIYAPHARAINPHGKKMWSVWQRNRHNAVSYHKSEATALKAMRRTIRAYYDYNK